MPVFSKVNKGWEVSYSYKKINEQTGKITPDILYDRPAQDVLNYLKNKAKEIIDRFDFKEVRAQATEVDKVVNGKVYYTYGGEILTHTERQ